MKSLAEKLILDLVTALVVLINPSSRSAESRGSSSEPTGTSALLYILLPTMHLIDPSRYFFASVATAK